MLQLLGCAVYNSTLSDDFGYSLLLCYSRCKGQIGQANNKHGCFPSLSSLAACFLCISLMYSWIPCLQICDTRITAETESWPVNMQLRHI